MDDPVDNAETNPAGLSHTRLIVVMGIVTVVGVLLLAGFVSLKFGLGFGLGGGLSFVNYFWMKRSLKSVFHDAAEGQTPSFVGGGYLMRYVAFATFLGFIYLLDWEFMIPVILGLTSFAFAVVIEGFIRIFGSVGNS